MSTNIVQLHQVGIKDIDLVGGKNASLGEMLQHLTKLGVNIPNGFVITVNAYQEFIEFNELDEKIRALVQQIDYISVESLRRAGLQIRNLIRNGRFPAVLSNEIINCYYELSEKYGQEITDVAVRSSATAEDLPDASFAGQQETYLNVRGPAASWMLYGIVLHHYLLTALFSYQPEILALIILPLALSVCIQKMVRSIWEFKGVAFSLDTESWF